MAVIRISGIRKGVPGAVRLGERLDLGSLRFDSLVAWFSESKKTSPFMEESSEQEGEWDRDLGTTIGPRFWQFLGGIGGRLGEVDGVEVLGDLEGV